MGVYFITCNQSTLSPIKIGRSKNITQRIRSLETASPNHLVLLGWINSQNDPALENKLHKEFQKLRQHGEWFNIDHNQILPILMEAHKNAFIPKNEDPFEIVGYDSDAVPEILGVCDWADLSIEQCCPFCGCLCGMQYQEASLMHHCINCQEITDFEEESPCPPNVKVY